MLTENYANIFTDRGLKMNFKKDGWETGGETEI